MLSLPKSSIQINAGEPTLENITSLCWHAITEVNDPPQLFRYGGHLVLLQEGDDGSPHLQPIDVDLAIHILARIATWFRVRGSDE